ncbi:Tim44 domain-containing protein [bacterium]|nr:Tim44 domain-containing protein [bacterium]MBR2273727.1 Tim44 domain-containing protein [Alphaproteobacteria bacterium]
MSEYLDIVFLVVLVIVIFSKLKSVLGTGTESTRVIMIPKDQLEKIYKEIKHNTDNVVSSESIDLDKLSPLERELARIPNFNKNLFIKGAQKAFEMILMSFSKGDSATLATLVNKELLKKFESVMKNRKEKGITTETDLIGFLETEVESVKFVDADRVNLVVKFVSEQVNLLKNADGEVIEGDENYVQKISDVWTFEKSLNPRVNNWLLCSTKKC